MKLRTFVKTDKPHFSCQVTDEVRITTVTVPGLNGNLLPGNKLSLYHANSMNIKYKKGSVIFVKKCLLMMVFLVPSSIYGNTYLRMQTDLGGIDIELFDIATPQTVANFLNYVNDGDYEGTFVHRSDPGFVLQMGGYIFDPNLGVFTNNSGIYHIPEDSPVSNEPGISNTRGTIAMAKLPTDPNSATSEFFFNLADNSANLDNQNGGFTVFGQVMGDGMDLIDKIVALERCKDIGYLLPRPCNNFPDVPLVGIEAPEGASFTAPVEQVNLVNLNNIGSDFDNDGIIDKVEDDAPNNGDANNDGVSDSIQTSVASFKTITGSYVLLESSTGSALKATNVLGQTYAMTTVDPFDPNNELSGLIILQGFFGTELSSIAPDGTATITFTLPGSNLPNSFFVYGSTPTNAIPHWYEFLFDNATGTGAEINGNVITLHYADGKRGDGDLLVNGSILVAPGGAVRTPGDNDGIPDAIEDGAPNNGDGNGDGIPDSTQNYVTSLVDLRGSYITVEAIPSSVKLGSLTFSIGSNFLTQAVTSDALSGLNFVHGFMGFEATNISPGNAVDIRLILPANEVPVTFYKFGPTPDNQADHLYEFSFDGSTGIEINGNVITLHFVDGGRGDSDLTVNGVITDPGAPALAAAIKNSGGSGSGSGGCSLNKNTRSMQSGSWWLVLAMIFLLGFLRKSSYIRFTSQQACQQATWTKGL